MEKPSLDTAKAGAIRFNTDSSQLEIYDGNQWTGILATSPELQTGGTRGMQFAGNAPSYTNNFFNISTTGNGASFGSFASNRYFCDATASRTRAVVDSGEGNMTNREFFTIASGGGGTSFGSCYNHRSAFAFGSETRGVFGGGNDFSTYGLNTIEYVTISSEGSGIDYGDLSRTANLLPGFSSATRGVVLGDYSNNVATTQFMTISTGGTTSDYGDSTSRRRSSAAASNAVRGIEGGGITMPGSSRVNTLDFYTIATLNNAADFGDLTSARELLGGASSSTRAVFFGGETPSKVNTMDYVQFASEGDAIDFGDLTGSYYTSGGTSNGHGGL